MGLLDAGYACLFDNYGRRGTPPAARHRQLIQNRPVRQRHGTAGLRVWGVLL